MKIVILVCSLLFITSCTEKNTAQSDQRALRSLVERYVKAITLNNVKEFLECYLPDEKNQEIAEAIFRTYQLHRKFHSLIISKFGEEGWKTYLAHENPFVVATHMEAELGVEDIDSYLEGVHITENGNRATIKLPDSKRSEDVVFAIRENGLWCFEINKNASMELLRVLISTYENVIKVIDNNEVTAGDIGDRYGECFVDAVHEQDPSP